MLQVTDLKASYGSIEAIHGISLDVSEGEMVALLGVNGAGKSTTLKSIAGIMPSMSGSVVFEGKNLTGQKPETILRAGISLVPEGRDIFTNLTVAENLRMGAFAVYEKMRYEEDLDQIRTLFPILEERMRQPAGQLSGGEQQQLAIARALMSHPRLLMLDEPSLGLAPVLVDHIFTLIADLRQLGITILLVEQNVERTLEIVDRVYLLETGRVKFTGSAAELKAESRTISSAYLGGDE
ncbi:MAG TPA: ABC transporter ATP-binding protein [Clostridia bacterium]|nr:ABC transporter ATP-binding protein [Clostridia bacterium]